MQNLEYLIVLILCLSFPLGFTLFYKPFKLHKKRLLNGLRVIFIVSIPWLIWDVFATFRGHWSFNSDYILGPKIINLPFEEVLFFWVIPFCCLFVWELWDYLQTPKNLEKLN